MLIGICGATCAGKKSIANFLVQNHGFRRLHVRCNSAGITVPVPERLALPEHVFSDVATLLIFATKRWRERWVIQDITKRNLIEALLRRPFFLLISVEAPIGLRWQRHSARNRDNACRAPDLDQFVREHDESYYGNVDGLAHLADFAQIRLLNSSSSLTHLCAALAGLDLTNEERLRPTWDQYFMQLASLAAKRSNCMKRIVGCVLVREKRVISTGYNGTPRNMRNCNEGGCARCNSVGEDGTALSTCLCLHAEENALLEAGRERVREGAILYCDTCPCLTCSIKIVQVGISEVVYSKSYSMDGQTAAVFSDAGVKFRQFSPVRRIRKARRSHELLIS